MASSSEAFEKLSVWKNSKTWLNVIVIERGQRAKEFFLRIAGLDEEQSMIGVVGEAMHSFAQFDVGESQFSVEPKRLVVSREDIEWLIFEEED
jgi:hypothetical protein